MAARALWIGTEVGASARAVQALGRAGIAVREQDDVTRAIEALTSSHELEVAFVDLALLGGPRAALARSLHSARPDVPLVAFGPASHASDGWRAVREGAFDWIAIDAGSDAWAAAYERAQRHHRALVKLARLAGPSSAPAELGIVGKSAPAVRLRDAARSVAATQVSVLIAGERGTGREQIARTIHEQGSRRGGPFVVVRCAAAPSAVLASELFGHARGAYLDAPASRAGAIERARGGTLYLDDVDELSLDLQGLLVRALSERRVRPIGGSEDVPIDARIVAATTRDLATETRERRLREDLSYRLAACTIEVSPLRARKDDLPALVGHVLATLGAGARTIAPDAMRALVEHPWPGNDRELCAVLEHALAVAPRAEIQRDDLPATLRSPSRVDELGDALITLDELERRYVSHVLTAVRGNKSRAARILGLDRRTLHRKLERAAGSTTDPSEGLGPPLLDA